MKITLEIPPETELSLFSQAEARGITLHAYLQMVIANQAATESIMSSKNPSPEGADSDWVIDEHFDTVQVPPGMGEWAMRREKLVSMIAIELHGAM
jgi:hypothetical protein